MAVVLLALVGAVAWWLQAPLGLARERVEFTVAPGATPRAAAQAITQAGVQVPPTLLYAWFRLSGQGRQIRAGSYELVAGSTPRSLLRKLVRGEQALRSVTLVEGWSLRQMRTALAAAEHLKPDSAGLDDAALMAALGRAGRHPEGRFFPDSYRYAKGSSDLLLLRQALHAMDQQLEAAWRLRQAGTPLKSAEDLLILASIVEKETGRASDRALVAGVFTNRLRIGMLLQTDPTVIYGLGPDFDGNLRKRHLQTDNPWNTYTRTGLPPTPIAMPGAAALLAAVQPAATPALYFVAKGDGSSHFSATLDAHNRAVNQYQRGL